MMQNTLSDHVHTTFQFIKNYFRINISLLSSSEEFDDFISHYVFHKTQRLVQKKSLEELMIRYPKESLLLTDNFNIHYLILYIENQPVLIGPFCTVSLSTHDAKLIFNKHGIEDISIFAFFSYYNSNPIWKESDILHFIESLENSLRCSFGMLRKIGSDTILFDDDDELDLSRFHKNGQIDMVSRMHHILVNKRYSYEKQFMLDIQVGNARSAIMNLKKIQADTKQLKKIGTILEVERLAAANTRTMVRIAAMQTNLPPFLIDTLVRENTKKVANARSVDEIKNAQDDLIRAFCNEIIQCRNAQYSALVQSMIYYFTHEYHREFDLSDLAMELNVSKTYMITRFHNEVGETPIEYLRKFRMKKAAALLTGSALSIQDISTAVGISDSNYFTKVFKKEYAMTPLVYRKQFES